MEEYIVSARKYRPLNFDSVVGQRALTTTLKNSIKSGKLAHAYLFCGPRGVGKTTCARIFAKAINCTSPREGGDACGECESCKGFDEQRSMNIHELDAASNNSVEDIRELCQQVQIPPQTGRYKVFIIDEVHMLSSAAFNAFLKTLEEPPSYVVFILATTEKHKILPTILSRCQVYDFQRMTTQGTVDHLKYVAEKEGYTAEPEALALIAEKADGGMRDALSIFDQMVSFTAGHLTYEQVCKNLNVLNTEYYFRLVDHFLKAEVEPCLLLLNEILMKGFEAGNFISGLSRHLRNLLVARDSVTLPLLEMSDKMRAQYQEQASRCKPRFIYRALKLCNDCDQAYRTSHNKRLQVEICLIQAAQINEDDAESSGLGPAKILKPIFDKLTVNRDVEVGTNIKPNNAKGTTIATPDGKTASITQQHKQIVTGQNTPEPLPKQESTQQDAKKPILRRVTFKHFGCNNPVLQEEDAQQTAREEHIITPLNEDNVRQAWFAYCANLPHDRVAASQRMKGMTPVVTGTSTFEITVNNQIVRQQMDEEYADIVAFMSKMLRNTELSFTIRLAEVQEVTKYFNPTERLANMEKHNPNIRSLIDRLHLQID